MTQYAFVEKKWSTLPGLKKADPQLIGEELDRIREKHDGALRPRDVVNQARVAHSPLHSFFEWNNTKAAEAYRVDQARTLIRSIRLVEPAGESLPAFISLSAPLEEDASPTVSYRSISDVLNSEVLRGAVLRAAERDLLAWTRRYENLREIVDLVGPALSELRHRLSDAEDRPSP